MPSLFKYFTIVGGGLLGLLIALDTVMQPGGPGPSLVNVAEPKVVAVKHDPQASRVERLRAEEAALEATLKTELSPATEPPWVCRRPFGLSHAAMAGCSSMA